MKIPSPFSNPPSATRRPTSARSWSQKKVPCGTLIVLEACASWISSASRSSPQAMALYAGAGAGRIGGIIGAAERLHRIVTDTAALLDSGATPPHSADGMHDTPLAYANREELLATLNELPEAERAGARVTSRTAAEIVELHLKQRVARIRQDEARWCGVLMKVILSLNATPTRRTGAIYEKAMSITDLSQRLAYLIRGQGWVVRKLQALLPGVHDARIRTDLAAMLASHEENMLSWSRRYIYAGCAR